VRPIALVGLIALCGWVLSAPASEAEDSGFPGFLLHLFSPPQPKAPEPAPAPVRKPRKKAVDFVPVTTTREPGAPGGAPVQPTFFVDVLGDSLATLAADGLGETFVEKPEISIVNRAKESSGLTRDDYYDWPKTARDLASAKDRIDFVVVMLGINDLQPLKDGADNLDPLSDKWKAIYAKRVEALVAPFRDAHIPVAWVGLPPMRTEKINAQVLKLNEIDRERAEKAGAKYIDIWDAFANQDGQYDAFGPNVDGQNVKLRGADGILFTKAGSRKVAHFLEADIKRVFDKDRPQNDNATLPPDIEQAAGDINAQIRREMGAPEGPAAPGSPAPLEPPKPLAGPILSLTARPISPGGALMARETTLASEPDSVARVLRRGEPVNPRTGRADDFSWPRL
jgi:hypothetical protein